MLRCLPFKFTEIVKLKKCDEEKEEFYPNLAQYFITLLEKSKIHPKIAKRFEVLVTEIFSMRAKFPYIFVYDEDINLTTQLKEYKPNIFITYSRFLSLIHNNNIKRVDDLNNLFKDQQSYLQLLFQVEKVINILKSKLKNDQTNEFIFLWTNADPFLPLTNEKRGNFEIEIINSLYNCMVTAYYLARINIKEIKRAYQRRENKTLTYRISDARNNLIRAHYLIAELSNRSGVMKDTLNIETNPIFLSSIKSYFRGLRYEIDVYHPEGQDQKPEYLMNASNYYKNAFDILNEIRDIADNTFAIKLLEYLEFSSRFTLVKAYYEKSLKNPKSSVGAYFHKQAIIAASEIKIHDSPKRNSKYQEFYILREKLNEQTESWKKYPIEGINPEPIGKPKSSDNDNPKNDLTYKLKNKDFETSLTYLECNVRLVNAFYDKFNEEKKNIEEKFTEVVKVYNVIFKERHLNALILINYKEMFKQEYKQYKQNKNVLLHDIPKFLEYMKGKSEYVNLEFQNYLKDKDDFLNALNEGINNLFAQIKYTNKNDPIETIEQNLEQSIIELKSNINYNNTAQLFVLSYLKQMFGIFSYF